MAITMHDKTIPVFKPLILQDELDAAAEALRLGWLGMGSYVAKFEQELAAFLEAEDRYVAAVSTGHAALHLALIVAGVGPGDEVITPAFNNIADFQAILAVGAEPVFCDIDEDTLCIDMDRAAELVSGRTKAIIAMDYDCLLCDHDRIRRFAEASGLRVIHDAAHSFGSRYRGRMIGSFSDLCMFSFDPVKTITSIDGGLLVVRSEAELNRLHELRLIGMTQPVKLMYQNRRAWSYDVRELGFRYHMANLHAAIGLAQLAKIGQISASRREACRYYNQGLRDVSSISVPQTDFEDVTPFLYYIRVPAERRNALREHLTRCGVDSGIHWQPGHSFSLLQDCRRGPLEVTDRVAGEILSLPLHSVMERRDQDQVIEAARSFFA
jgi:dTDP-4-amino-4,6-dideoxygalactose transaminase